jgi:hypothetical protein
VFFNPREGPKILHFPGTSRKRRRTCSSIRGGGETPKLLQNFPRYLEKEAKNVFFNPREGEVQEEVLKFLTKYIKMENETAEPLASFLERIARRLTVRFARKHMEADAKELEEGRQ